MLPQGSAPREQGGVPAWAVHVAPQEVDIHASVDTLGAELVEELGSGTFLSTHHSPEQVAILAIHELEKGHPFDATVLLALASMRRLEQAEAAHAYAISTGLKAARERYGVQFDEPSYLAYCSDEVSAFREATFVRDLARVAAQVEVPLADRSAETSQALSVERVFWPQLADAVLAYLESVIDQGRAAKQHAQSATLEEHAPRILDVPLLDVAEPLMPRPPELGKTVDSMFVTSLSARYRRLAVAAVRFMARVPIERFRMAALHNVETRFDDLVIRAGVQVYARSPEAVVAALAHPRAATRAHAAVVLGMVEDSAWLPVLREALDTEDQAPVQLALRYALLRLGERDQMAALRRALREGPSWVTEHATWLVEGLPWELQQELSEWTMASVMASARSTQVTRRLAAKVLLNRGAARPLSPATILSLLDLAPELAHEPAELRAFSESFGKLRQLDRAQAVHALRRERSARIVPWFSRLARLVKADELANIGSLIPFAVEEGVSEDWLVELLSGVPGRQAQGLLQRWFISHERLRDSIAYRLVMRDDLDRSLLRELMKGSGPAHRAMFGLAVGDLGVGPALARAALSSDGYERYTATLAVALLGESEHEPLLWANAAYHSREAYPADVSLRQLALSSLLDLRLPVL